MKSKASWELFEIEACDYLNNQLNETNFHFEGEGGNDSTLSDIKVFENSNYLFTIEAKYSPAQSGQIALAENNGLYILSDASKGKNNPYTPTIINHLNENKSTYSPTKQKAISIKLDERVLSQWIIKHYQNKNSKFIITSTQLNSFKVILPTHELMNYFDVSAVIRRKKSGTRDVAKKNIQSCMNELKQYLSTLNLQIINTISEDKKTRIILNSSQSLTKSECYFGEKYFLSKAKDNDGYYLKQTSNTNNLNILFKLVFTRSKSNVGIEALKDYLTHYSR